MDELVTGSDLTGDVATTGMLPRKFTPALIIEEDLRSQSSLRRALVEQDCTSSGDDEVDLEVWRQND